MRPVKGLGLLAALTIALGMVGAQPAVAPGANKVEAASSAQLAVRNLAYANLGISACQTNSLGGLFFAPDGTMSCSTDRLRPFTGWCAIFAGWVWNLSGHVYTKDRTGKVLGHYPSDFETYGRNNLNAGLTDGLLYANAKDKKAPAVGDVVIFRTGSQSYPSHVAIVYSVSGSKVVTVAGNEPGSTNSYVGMRTFDYLSPNTPSTPTTANYYPYEYIKALIH